MIRALSLSAIVAVFPVAATAHGLNVFASANCDRVLVEAKFSNGRVAQKGEVRVFDGENVIQSKLELNPDGTVEVPLNSVDHSGGLVIEVDTGDHDDYWILTPDDIARDCGS